MENIREELQKLVEKFNTAENKKKEKLENLDSKINIVFEDDGTYRTHLKGGRLSEIEDGTFEPGDITIITTTGTFMKILSKEEDAMTAYITKKIKVKAKLMDKLLLSDILG